uniref:uncharacterized protein isoform X2 n=1 Tax=Myxine glutinosa TaxID=7769 RepID=UPI00358F0C9D
MSFRKTNLKTSGQSQTSQSPLGTLGATLYTNSRTMGGIFCKVPGKQGVYRLRVGTALKQHWQMRHRGFVTSVGKFVSWVFSKRAVHPRIPRRSQTISLENNSSPSDEDGNGNHRNEVMQLPMKPKCLLKGHSAQETRLLKERPGDMWSPGSPLEHMDLKTLVNDSTLSALPFSCQKQLVGLLPKSDVQVTKDRVHLSSTALNNEFFNFAAAEWMQRLAEGEFVPETQIRKKQDKDKPTESWKEVFFEEYYGEKSDLMHKELMEDVENGGEDLDELEPPPLSPMVATIPSEDLLDFDVAVEQDGAYPRLLKVEPELPTSNSSTIRCPPTALCTTPLKRCGSRINRAAQHHRNRACFRKGWRRFGSQKSWLTPRSKSIEGKGVGHSESLSAKTKHKRDHVANCTCWSHGSTCERCLASTSKLTEVRGRVGRSTAEKANGGNNFGTSERSATIPGSARIICKRSRLGEVSSEDQDEISSPIISPACSSQNGGKERPVPKKSRPGRSKRKRRACRGCSMDVGSADEALSWWKALQGVDPYFSMWDPVGISPDFLYAAYSLFPSVPLLPEDEEARRSTLKLPEIVRSNSDMTESLTITTTTISDSCRDSVNERLGCFGITSSSIHDHAFGKLPWSGLLPKETQNIGRDIAMSFTGTSKNGKAEAKPGLVGFPRSLFEAFPLFSDHRHNECDGEGASRKPVCSEEFLTNGLRHQRQGSCDSLGTAIWCATVTSIPVCSPTLSAVAVQVGRSPLDHLSTSQSAVNGREGKGWSHHR